MNPRITKKVSGEAALFIVNWSKVRKADRHDISKSVPAIAGIYEFYYLDRGRTLKLIHIGLAWYGGLRSTLRVLCDSSLPQNPLPRALVDNFDLYYRYSHSDSYADMSDVLFFFNDIGRPLADEIDDSGRYETVEVNENSPEKIITIRKSERKKPL